MIWTQAKPPDSVDTRMETASTAKPAINLRYLILLASAAALGALLFGFDIAIITGAGPFLVEHFGLNDLGLGWAFSSLLFGCVVGSLAAGRFADRYGRKTIMAWVAVLFAVTSIAAAVAPTFHLFVAARFAGGLAVGAVSLLAPMYISEVSPPSMRGRMGSLYQMSIVIGILISYGINYLLRNSGPDNWRWMFATGVLPSILFFVLMLIAPETPRFLMMAGKRQEAFQLLENISNRETAAFEVAEIEAAVAKGPGGREGMRRPGVTRALKVSFFLAILIHVSGINTIVDYAPAIFRSAGWKMDGALAATFLIGITELVFTISSFWMIDRFGRKPLYVTGSAGMAIALLLLIVTVATDRFHGPLVLALILAYLAFFSSCIGPVFWTLIPEIFPTDVRGIAMTVPVLTQWITNAFVVLFFPYAFNQIGKAVTFGFLAVMCLTQAIFTWFFVPETKNQTLEEIEQFWNANAGS